MYPISNAVKALFEAEQRQVLRITGTDKNGTAINITDADVVIGSFNIDRFSCVGNKLEIGTATSAQMTVKLDNHDGRFNGIVFEGTELFVEIGIADWTQSNPTINWIPCGYFTPDEQPRSLNIITIHALDRMMRFDATMPTLTPWVTQSGDVMTDSQGNIIYFVSNVQFPVTVQNLVKRVALLCGVPFTQSLSNLPNYSYTISALPTLQQEITFRNIIQWCAGIMGANAWIDWTGSLRFSWYGATTGYTSTTANRFSSDLHEDDITITGVKYTNTQNVTIVSGSADYAIDMTGNYLAAVGISTILPNIRSRISGFTYRPFTATVINVPYLWPMDMITFVKDGVNHTCAVTNVNFGINGTTALEGKGETAQTNSGISPNGVSTAQGFLIEQASEATRELDESLSQEGIFNRLTNNGEVQGLILYNGKVYLNAEYIQTGTLAANLLMAGILTVGGANDGNGQIRILDGNGSVIGLWNKNGIQISSGNINLNYNSTLSIAFDSDSTKKAVFNNSGFKLTLNSGATIATGSIIYTSSNYYPNVDMGSLMCGYTSESDGTWGTTMAPGYLSMSHYANYVVDRSFIYNQKSLSVFVYAGGTIRSFDVDLENNSMTFSGGFTLRENLTVLGAKSRAVSTDQYSDRLLYCYETPSPMFGDVGEGTIGEDGKCYIWLDPVFAQTITTTQYQVFLQRYGSGECWVSERKGSYFVVEGTPGMAFGWELKAKQRDFDQRRLERNDEPFTIPKQTYGEDAAKHIDDLRKERISA